MDIDTGKTRDKIPQCLIRNADYQNWFIVAAQQRAGDQALIGNAHHDIDRLTGKPNRSDTILS